MYSLFLACPARVEARISHKWQTFLENLGLWAVVAVVPWKQMGSLNPYRKQQAWIWFKYGMTCVQRRSAASVCHLSSFSSITFSYPYVGLPVHILSIFSKLEVQLLPWIKGTILKSNLFWQNFARAIDDVFACCYCCKWKSFSKWYCAIAASSRDVKSDKSATYLFACSFKTRWTNFRLWDSL